MLLLYYTPLIRRKRGLASPAWPCRIGAPMCFDQRPTHIVYDGRCGLCQRSMRSLAARDARKVFRFVDLHSVDVTTMHPSLTREACLDALHVVTPRGRVLQGFFAFRHVWARSPWTAWLVPALYVPGVPLIGRTVYRWVARRRYRLASAARPTGSCALHSAHSTKEAS